MRIHTCLFGNTQGGNINLTNAMDNTRDYFFYQI